MQCTKGKCITFCYVFLLLIHSFQLSAPFISSRTLSTIHYSGCRDFHTQRRVIAHLEEHEVADWPVAVVNRHWLDPGRYLRA